jgi:hypothetical protein
MGTGKPPGPPARGLAALWGCPWYGHGQACPERSRGNGRATRVFRTAKHVCSETVRAKYAPPYRRRLNGPGHGSPSTSSGQALRLRYAALRPPGPPAGGASRPCGDDLRQIATHSTAPSTPLGTWLRAGCLAMTAWGEERFQIADFRLQIEGGKGP